MSENAPPTYEELLALVASLQADLAAAREEIAAWQQMLRTG